MVRPANQAAIDFYRKFGFKRIGTIPRYYEDGSDAARMVQQPVKRSR
jgi:ribosomal protein S18 acetylase RimI-like enzyme